MSPAADALKLKVAEAVDGLALASAKRDFTNGGGA
jgi:hypothetical protein